MKLHNYQERAVKFMTTTDKAILSVGMGLGKTAATLNYINQLRPRTCLIVAPKRVAEHVWKQEAQKWGLMDVYNKMQIVAGTKAKRKQIIESGNYLIIGRDNLADVTGMSFDLLVIDELTSFKNINSKRTDAICSIQARQKIGLTGTFLTNGAMDMFGQFAALGIGNMKTKKERINQFYRWRSTHFKDLLAGSGLQFQKWKLITPLPELIKNVRPNIFTLDSADWLEIPQVEYIRHDVELSEPEMNEYLRLNTMLNVRLDDEVVSFNEAQKFAKLQTLCNGFVYRETDDPVRSEYSTKLDDVCDFVDRCVSEGEQVLLFYAFREEKVWLQEKLKKLHISFTDVRDGKFMEKWNNGDVEVLLAHPASAGHGLNLQSGGRMCVWSTIPFDLEHWLQANARLARQGQNRGVQIHSFITKGTVELRKYTALRDKTKVLNEFVNLTK